MLSLRIGVWDDPKKSHSSGTFNVLGKSFVVFVDKNTNKNKNPNANDNWVPVKNPNAPDLWVTIKEKKSE